ncbi:ORF006 [Saltwater crocodilepox virus]|nr:ORF006 [Saltwater crocodilepox virus]QGT48803.1 ORF006 [Saltwater crocodilepox virus]QGT49016.1 ORF006 [Saltwater crocodilepox virus]
MPFIPLVWRTISHSTASRLLRRAPGSVFNDYRLEARVYQAAVATAASRPRASSSSSSCSDEEDTEENWRRGRRAGRGETSGGPGASAATCDHRFGNRSARRRRRRESLREDVRGEVWGDAPTWSGGSENESGLEIDTDLESESDEEPAGAAGDQPLAGVGRVFRALVLYNDVVDASLEEFVAAPGGRSCRIAPVMPPAYLARYRFSPRILAQRRESSPVVLWTILSDVWMMGVREPRVLIRFLDGAGVCIREVAVGRNPLETTPDSDVPRCWTRVRVEISPRQFLDASALDLVYVCEDTCSIEARCSLVDVESPEEAVPLIGGSLGNRLVRVVIH